MKWTDMIYETIGLLVLAFFIWLVFGHPGLS